MKKERNPLEQKKGSRPLIFPLALLAAVLLWCTEGFLDFFVFYDDTLPNLLLTGVPTHELYHRGVAVALLIGFGYVSHWLFARNLAYKENLEHLNAVLRAIRSVNRLITQESNPEVLVEQATWTMTETLGYRTSWIVLFDQQGKPEIFSQSGIGDKVLPFQDALMSGKQLCCLSAQTVGGVATLVPSRDCGDCPRASDYRTQYALSAPLTFAGHQFGQLTVSVDDRFAADSEELRLFSELARDLGLALYNITAEKERQTIQLQLQQAQKMEAVGRLAGGVAHDFNNMLNVILGYVQILLEDARLDGQHHEYLMEVQRAAQNSADLTRQLLAFARNQVAQSSDINLNREVEKQQKMLGRLIGEEILIEFTPGQDLWPVAMDPTHVGQILANLAVNAKDAISGQGSIFIATGNITLDEEFVRLHPYAKVGEFVRLTFRDSGMGMDKEVLSRAFEPFFTTKPDGRGTGLGLATVFGIVKQNGGFITTRSQPNKGTIFEIFLPRQTRPSAAESREKRFALPQGFETILVVEDQQQVLRLIENTLIRSGFKVLAFASPAEALEAAASYRDPIDLLVTDVVMPGLNGKELEERIRQSRPTLKSLFISGYTANVIAGRGVDEGEIHFLPKPFTHRELLSKVRLLLDA